MHSFAYMIARRSRAAIFSMISFPPLELIMTIDSFSQPLIQTLE